MAFLKASKTLVKEVHIGVEREFIKYSYCPLLSKRVGFILTDCVSTVKI